MGFSVLGFWLFLVRFFGFAVLFGLRILRSLAYGLRDPILDPVCDPIRSDPIPSGPIQILSTPQGSFFIALSPVLTGKRPKWWDVPLLISFYCMPQ